RERQARESGNTAQANAFAEAARITLDGWYASGDIVREAVASPELIAQVRDRGAFARRFDPLRSTVEHDALRRRKVGVLSEAANLRLAHHDLCAEFGVPDLERAYEQRVAENLDRAGILDAFLIRNLDMVEFSFGFTRVAAAPMTVQKDRP